MHCMRIRRRLGEAKGFLHAFFAVETSLDRRFVGAALRLHVLNSLLEDLLPTC